MDIELLRQRATKFAKTFETAHSEISDGQNFIRDFCELFGLNYRRAVSFEKKIKKLNNKPGRIDGFFPSLLLVEMKSAGKNLENAYQQATSYFSGLKDEEMPRYVLVSDFQQLHLYDQETHGEPLKIKLVDLPQHIESFRFLEGYEKIAIEKQDRINRHAAEKMADLHDAIKKTGYTGKDLETYLVRLLFCLFADNTNLFGENNQFLKYLINYTKPDGSDLHGALNKLFDTLNLPDNEFLSKTPNYKGKKRLNNLPEYLNKFSYINGLLFEGILAECYFDETSRNTLIECAQLDWSEISPAIFGALFQEIMHFDDEQSTAKTKKRREFGAHYTSEENILKTINPLFMNDLKDEFAKCRHNKKQLIDFHHKLKNLTFFDPACGCGNFLIIAYRELRLLELEIIKALQGETLDIDVSTLIWCDVDQFYGIDIDESAIHIATVAMWLTDHQMNLKVQQLGQYFNRIPLKKKANIFQANALRIDWKTVISPDKCSFIMGNPPFVGKKEQSVQQKSDLQLLTNSIKGAGVLDYVTGWYFKATNYIQENQNIRCAFVSTNSICQGEQVGILWAELLKSKITIHFAYRTFKWRNEGRGVAAVHCVIIGFGLSEPKQRLIFDGDQTIFAKNINPYLIDAPNIFIEKSTSPLSHVPSILEGITPLDNGLLSSFTREEYLEFITKEPSSKKWFKKWVTGESYINNKELYCLWLSKILPHELKSMPYLVEIIKKVKEFRTNSKSSQAFAVTPWLFRETTIPDKYLIIPKTSSENRQFVPLGFIENSILSNSSLLIPDATLYHFGILTSTMHNAWMRAVCGRLESRYRYSASIVYNNFPFPNPTEKQIKVIEEKAQAVLEVRKEYPTSTLADLYDPLIMPPNLLKVHKELDKAVDAAYNYKGSKEDAARVAFLFELYQKVTSPLIKEKSIKKSKPKTK